MTINHWSGTPAYLKLISIVKKDSDTHCTYRIANISSKRTSYIRAIDLVVDTIDQKYYLRVYYQLIGCEAIQEALLNTGIIFTHNRDVQICAFHVSEKESVKLFIQNIKKSNRCHKKVDALFNSLFPQSKL